MNRVHTISAICASAGFIGAINAAVIGIDNRNGYDADNLLATGSDYDQFRSIITSMGHTIIIVNDFTDLSGLDSLIVQNPHSVPQEYSIDDMNSISSFVAAGGGLLAHGEAGGATSAHLHNMNTMTTGFGAEFQMPELNGAGLLVSDFVAHEVTDGITQVGVDYYRKVTVSGDTMDLTGDASDFLAARDGVGSAGNSVFLGDISLWKDAGAGSDYSINDVSNELLLQNIIGYIVPAPSSLALLAGTALLIPRRRR
jgi:hypothetical protein